MIRVVTDLTKYELDIRAVINVFYPQRIVVFNDKRIDEEVRMTIEIKVCVSKIEVLFFYDGNSLTVEEIIKKVDCGRHTDAELLKAREVKNKVKLCLYNGLSQITGCESQWGTLTGVRPTKLAFMLKKEGLNQAECIKRLHKDYLCSEDKAKLILEIADYEYKKVADYIDEGKYSLYIGIPFCPTTCLYCSFASNPVGGNREKVAGYLEALHKEIVETACMVKDKKLISVYIGGGTPTALSETQLDDLLTKVKTEFNLEQVVEYTVEAGRPDSITREKLEVLKKHGVTRISINPQVMNDEVLKLIGRRHSVLDIKEKYNMARQIGFDNINMDLIMGLPGQNVDMAKDTIEQILELNPESVTVHTLSLKKNSALTHTIEEYEQMMVRDVETMVTDARKTLKDNGYIPYYMYRQKNIASHLENVGYAKEGYESVYNILMMEEMQTIVACGAGTISKKVVRPRLLIEGEKGVLPSVERHDNPKNLKDYVERIDEIIARKKKFYTM